MFILTAVVTRAQCSNGFPDRLAVQVFRTESSARLIPEMKFTCNGTIVGYTVAGRLSAENENAAIQVWRESTSQPGVYHKIGPDIRINEEVCSQSSAEPDRVFQCRLDGEANATTVQPGDILGLDIPPPGDNNQAGFLGSARVSSGPNNYVFEQQPLSSPVALSNSTSVNQDLPQVALEIDSGIYT